MKLYHFQSCPYCSYVRDEFQKMGLVSGKDYELIEASRGTPGREKVIQLGGKSQVLFSRWGYTYV